MHAPTEGEHAQKTKRRDEGNAKESADDLLNKITCLVSWRLCLFHALGSRLSHRFRWRFDRTLLKLIHCEVYDSFRRQPMVERHTVGPVHNSHEQNRGHPLGMRAQVAKNTRRLKENAG